MMRSPIIHGVLLVVMLGVAYQTWTREKKVETKTGNVTVWNEDSSKLTSLVFETKNRTLRIERRGTGEDSYLWGKEIRTRKVRKPRPKPAPTADKDAGPSKPPPPEFEEKITTREFPIGDAGIKLAKNFSRLRALRDLGQVTDEHRKSYKLDNSIDNVTVSFAGGKTHSLVMGGRVHGTGNRYFVDPETNKGYVLAGPLVSPLSAGETTLTLKKLHAYAPGEEKKVTIKVAGKERKLVRLETKVGKGKIKRKRKTWADVATPTKADQTMANVLDHIAKLKPAQYVLDKKTDGLELLAEVEYQDASGKRIGFVKLYREAPEAETAPADVAPGNVVPKKTAPKKTAPKKTAPKKDKAERELAEGGEEAEQATPRAKKPRPKLPAKTAKKKAPAAKRPDPRKAAAQAKMRKQMQDKIKAMQAKAGKARGPRGPHAGRPARAPKPRKPQAKYYILTERTQVLGLLRRPTAERLSQDLKQVFGISE